LIKAEFKLLLSALATPHLTLLSLLAGMGEGEVKTGEGREEVNNIKRTERGRTRKVDGGGQSRER
jgi:hypothetical protein